MSKDVSKDDTRKMLLNDPVLAASINAGYANMFRKEKYIGLSLSFTIKDICENRVPMDAIEAIVPNFVIDESNTLDDVFERYSESYWSKYKDRAREVLNSVKLLPRHPGGVNIAAGHYILASKYSPSLTLNYDHENYHVLPQDQDIGDAYKLRWEDVALQVGGLYCTDTECLAKTPTFYMAYTDCMVLEDGLCRDCASRVRNEFKRCDKAYMSAEGSVVRIDHISKAGNRVIAEVVVGWHDDKIATAKHRARRNVSFYEMHGIDMSAVVVAHGVDVYTAELHPLRKRAINEQTC